MADTFLRDLRIGLRILKKEKSFCALAIVALALGVSAVTTQFSVVNGVFLRGFSFPNASRLASVEFIDPASATPFGYNNQISSMDFEEFRAEQRSFERMASYLSGSTVNVTVNGAPQRYQGVYTTEDFLRILGLSPMLGRDFTAADNKAGAEKVALISYAIWQRDFGGGRDVIGKAVRINGKPATIVGVMPQGFSFPTNEDLWLPLYSEYPVRPRNDPRAIAPGVMALVRPGVSLDQANAEFNAFAKRFASAYPDTNKQFNAALVEPLIRSYTPVAIRGTLWTMLGFCIGVLLIACVNVMNMQFARATLRARELAVRSSLGATRSRLLMQMLTESLVLALAGGALGIGVAVFSVDWVNSAVHNVDTPPPSWMTFDIDGRVLAVTVLVTLLAAVVSGLLPAWMASRQNIVATMREGGRGHTSRAVNVIARGLVVVQIVVTCILLIGSLLQVRSIVNQQQVDYGYDTSGVLSARMGLMEGAYPDEAARKLFYDRLLRDLRNAPEFSAAGLTNRFRMVFSGTTPIEIEGRKYQDKRDRPNANFEQVSAGLFDVTRQRILEGRAFTDDDLDSRQPVAIVNAAFTKKHFGTESAIGRRFRTVDNNTLQPGPWRTIVGVVSMVRMQAPFNIPNVDDTGFYVPFYSNPTGPATAEPFAIQFATIAVTPRPGQRADTLGTALRREVAKVDPDLPLYFVGTPKAQLDVFVAQNRIIATMFTIFGLVAVVLSAVGIYGVMSFAVSQRTHEFGVRMALGADQPKILGMVFRQGTLQIGLGLSVGLGLAFLIATLGGAAIGNMLFNVSARDPFSYAVVTALVAVVSLVATLFPAHRATRVDPMIALRAE